MNNYLSAAGLIIAKLQSAVNVPSRNVRQAPSIDWAVENKLDDSISVIFYDDVPDTSAGGTRAKGRGQAAQQYWMLLIAIRNVSDAGSAARQEAGVILNEVLTALQGWPPSAEHGELNREKSPYRSTDRDGYVFIPLLFSTRIFTTGAG